MSRRLVTIGLSHYCEKSRWALRRSRLPFVEEAHAPGLHVPFVRLAGGTRSTPVLVDDGRVIADSTLIFDHLQSHPDSAFRPWPEGPDGAEARALEADFDDRLGPHVRRYAYHHLLDDRRLTVDLVGSRTRRREAVLFDLGFPGIRWLMRRSMRIDEAGAERSRQKVDAVLDEVDARLADGRRYLVGDRFTAADLTFAALAAVVVLHPAYLEVEVGRLPAVLRERTLRTRERPCGRFVWRMFEEERP